ncbi:MAG: hypothetical protein L0Y68_02255, partial [Candidatus Dadabacteria bacterium]|nr:hypothetical protein [Candidatus Dadabacteria bacterium]
MDRITALNKSVNRDNLTYSNTLDQVFDKIIRGERVLKLSGLKGSSKSYLISALTKKIERPILFIVPSKEIGEVESENIAFYSGEKPPFLLKKEPDLGDSLFSSVAEEAAERISWLYLADKKKVLL